MAPNPDLVTGAFVPGTILIASLLGSAHCAGMCGGLVFATVRSKKDAWTYHFARLAGYLLLGGVAGWLGAQIFSQKLGPWLPWLASLMVVFTLGSLGLRAIQGKTLHFSLPAFLRAPFSKLFGASTSPATLGLLTAFLPCGWLYGFVLGAVATQSLERGAAFLFVFWLGTLPALVLGPVFVQSFLKPISNKRPWLSGGILFAAALATLMLRVAPPLVRHFHENPIQKSSDSPESCPFHSNES